MTAEQRGFVLLDDGVSGNSADRLIISVQEDGKGDLDNRIVLKVPKDHDGQEESSWDFDVVAVVFAIRQALFLPPSYNISSTSM